MAPEVPEDLSFGLSSVPTDATVVKPDQETDSRTAVPDVPEDLRIDSPAILAQPAFAGRKVSIGKLVLVDDENSDLEKEALGERINGSGPRLRCPASPSKPGCRPEAGE